MYLLKFYIYWKNQGKNRASVKIVLILCSVLYVNRTDVHSRSIVGDDVTRRRVHETEMLIIVIGNRFRLGFQRTLPTGLHKPSGGSHYRQQELIVRVRWHARVIFQGCYVEAASHRIASHLVGLARRRLAVVISMIYACPYGYRKIIVRLSPCTDPRSAVSRTL